MADKTFEKTIELPVDRRTAFEWHVRPGAFERLVPPWEDVRLVGRSAPIEVGASQTVTFPLGPLRMSWTSRISDVVPGESFEDVQVDGPFASWVHRHLVDERGDTSALTDRVAYRLPVGPLGALFGGGFARQKLERMFRYRHAVTANDLARHAAADVGALDVVVTGASGMVGSALAAFLTTGGHRVRRLVRGRPSTSDEFHWDTESGTIDPAAFEGADAVVHLAGENIAARRWSPRQKDRIRRSRLEGTRHVANGIRAAVNRPRAFVSASAVGIYGNRGDEELDESSAAGTGFLADVCGGWEREAMSVSGTRLVQVRFGVLLSAAGGALAKMLTPFKLGAGGRLGSGQQWMSWLALDDAVGVLHHALVTQDLEGPVNAVAPEPIRNADYTKTLGKVLGRPTLFPMPAAAARAAFGELADELLLSGQRVLPRKLSASGYSFAYPDLEGALRHQLGR